MLSAFLLLREAAHIAVFQQEPFTHDTVEAVEEALRQHRSENVELIERIATGEIASDALAAFEGDPARLMSDLKEYIGFLDLSRTEIVHEAICDTLAAIGLLNWRAEMDVLGDSAVECPLSIKEVGDLLILSLRCSRLLMIQSTTFEMAEHLAASEEQPLIGDAFAQMQARTNIIANMVRHLFGHMLTRLSLPPEQSQSLAAEFNRDVARLFRRTAERLIEPIQEIAWQFEDRGSFQDRLTEASKDYFDDADPSFLDFRDAIDGLVAASAV